MEFREITQEPAFIALLIYSIIMTLLTTGLLVTTYMFKRRYKKLSQANICKNLRNLNRKSVDNKYEHDSLSEQRLKEARSLRTSRLINEDFNELSEKMSINSQEPLLQSINQTIYHHYEEINSGSCRQSLQSSNPYETILEQVATSLTKIYGNPCTNEEIYERFIKEMIKKIRSKNSRLYKKIQFSKRQNEDVNENKKTKFNYDSGEESTYATYVSSTADYQKNKNKKRNINIDNNNSTITFGSTDHLKYLIESECSRSSDKNPPYLEAKRFCASSDCPEPLKKLCLSQGSNKPYSAVRPYSTSRGPEWSHKGTTLEKNALSLRRCDISSSGSSVNAVTEEEEKDSDGTEEVNIRPKVPPKMKSIKVCNEETF